MRVDRSPAQAGKMFCTRDNAALGELFDESGTEARNFPRIRGQASFRDDRVQQTEIHNRCECYIKTRGFQFRCDDARSEHEQWAASAWIGLYTTEFLRFRFGFEHRERLAHGGIDPSHERGPNDTVFFELTWVFGSHPAEPFWVNK